jgi:formylglycine-generating enzyme required for sulfatase activity
MGSRPDDDVAEWDEQVVRQVALTRPLLMQKTEVTQAPWAAVMGNSPSAFSGCGPTCPVENVSWDDIQQFLERLNAMDRGKKYRLPTEAEWEYAARAGSEGSYGRTAGGTVILDQMGWYRVNASEKTHPVAQKTPNVWELYDMHGNVSEWVADVIGSYDGAPTRDPQGPRGRFGMERVLRGGSYDEYSHEARSGYRQHSISSSKSRGIGFRLARTL